MMLFGEMKTVLVIVLLVLVVGGFGGRKFRSNPLESPCPDVFQYRYDEQGQLYGILRINNPEDPTVVKLQVELSVGNNVEVIALRNLQLFLRQCDFAFMYYKSQN